MAPWTNNSDTGFFFGELQAQARTAQPLSISTLEEGSAAAMLLSSPSSHSISLPKSINLRQGQNEPGGSFSGIPKPSSEAIAQLGLQHSSCTRNGSGIACPGETTECQVSSDEGFGPFRRKQGKHVSNLQNICSMPPYINYSNEVSSHRHRDVSSLTTVRN